MIKHSSSIFASRTMASRGVPEVRLANHGLTSKSRMYPTKNGSWTRDGIEKKTYSEWKATFSGTSTESRNRPVYGFQEMAHTLLLAEARLRDGVDCLKT